MPRTTVIFYQEGGTAPVVEWLKKLPRKVQVKCQAFLAQLEEFGHQLRRPVADYLRDGIHELRPSYQGVQYRILYFYPERKKGETAGPARVVVVSHGLIKESTVPDGEIQRAIERKKRYEADPERHTFRPEGKR